ncbi:hypothetical protein [Shewanella sp. 10N.286.54.B9]|uniref:hypothetical protein n=1 Tax=Shewanella sp. 10N.286.54.B9 TaxID=3229719 RepID=UPI003551951B
MLEFKCISRFGDFRAGYIVEIIDGKEVIKNFVVRDGAGKTLKTGCQSLADAISWARATFMGLAISQSNELAKSLEELSQNLELVPEQASETDVITEIAKHAP